MKENAILRLNTLVLFILFFPLTVKSAEDIESFSIGEINVLGTNSKDEDSDALADSYRSPIPSTYLGKDRVERFRGTRNTDIFNDITGVQMNNPANEAGALDLGIRGMQGNGRVPVVIDDTVQSTLTERGYQGSSDRTYIDMDLIRSVRVDKGPTIGSDTVGATGGRVEMRTINANDVIPQGDSFGINFNFGTYNNNRMPHEFGDSSEQLNYRLQREQKTTHFRNGFYSLAMAGKNDYGSVLLAYTERTTGNYFAGKNKGARYDNGNKFDQVTRPGQEVANTSNENVSFLAKVSADFSHYNKLLLTYRHHHQQAGEILSAYLTKNQNTNGEDTQAQWSLGTANLDAFSATHSYKSPVHNWLNLKSTFFYTELQTEQHNGFLGSGSYGDQYWNSVRDRRVGINASNTSLFPALPVVGDFKAEYGFAMEQQLIGPRVTERSSGATNIDGNRRSNSLFTNLTIDPTHWVTVAVGLRKNIVNLHSNRQAEYTKNIFDDAEHGGGGWASYLPQGLPKYCPQFADGKPFNADKNDPDSVRKNCVYTITKEVTGKSKSDFRYNLRPDLTTSLTFHLTPEIDLYTSYANVSRAPSAYEQISSGGTMKSASHRGQSFVDAENTQNIEFGASGQFKNVLADGDKMLLRMSRFYNNNRNYIAPAATSEGLYAFVNYDKYSTQGTELSVNYDTGKFYTSVGWTHYDKQEVCAKALSVNEPECNTTGFAYGGISSRIQPEDNVVMSMGYRFFDDKSLDLGARYRYNSSKKNPENWLQGTAAQQVMEGADANSFFDLYASYEVNKNITVQAGIDNLTNQYAIAPGAIVWIPEPGRTWRFTVRTKF